MLEMLNGHYLGPGNYMHVYEPRGHVANIVLREESLRLHQIQPIPSFPIQTRIDTLLNCCAYHYHDGSTAYKLQLFSQYLKAAARKMHCQKYFLLSLG